MLFWLQKFEDWLEDTDYSIEDNLEQFFVYLYIKALDPANNAWGRIKMFRLGNKVFTTPLKYIPFGMLTQNMPSFLNGVLDYSDVNNEMSKYVDSLRAVFSNALGDCYEIFANFLLAESLYHQNELDKSLCYIEDALEQCQTRAIPELLFIVLCQLCMVQRAMQKKRCQYYAA